MRDRKQYATIESYLNRGFLSKGRSFGTSYETNELSKGCQVSSDPLTDISFLPCFCIPRSWYFQYIPLTKINGTPYFFDNLSLPLSFGLIFIIQIDLLLLDLL